MFFDSKLVFSKSSEFSLKLWNHHSTFTNLHNSNYTHVPECKAPEGHPGSYTLDRSIIIKAVLYFMGENFTEATLVLGKYFMVSWNDKSRYSLNHEHTHKGINKKSFANET